MFTHLLVLLCASAFDVGGCTLGFPVCCVSTSDDYSEGTRCQNVPNVNACSKTAQTTTTLCCEDVSSVNLNGTATDCTAYE
ncbi:hypothetical protein DFJ58DRAFT_762397 [Suillus subalutaceus]|uniref:uncharacterized protein n=1 Tax=Suillus subalutaceus TaxID=48586 RepID=UPI001B878ACF|nr:uncharacterized protein DFJ58DRAFT_762397 [Suillus subalutaceus]KAG1871781.1 hypothetical protein DFJ58DRAFT_762397 [Suillus subalutaceus]